MVAAPAAAQTSAIAISQLIVKFRDDGARAGLLPAMRVSALAGDAGVTLARKRSMALGAEVVTLFRALPAGEARALAARLRAHPDVEFAEPDGWRRGALVPNDPRISQQPYLDNSPGGINAFAAWDLSTGSTSVVVAIVDSGLTNHVELSGRTVPGYDFIADPKVANDGDGRDPDPSDPGDWITVADLADPAFSGGGCMVENSSWHGTGVAGVIAATGNNGIGNAGLDWSARIQAARVLGKCGGLDSDIVDGIAWAAGLPVPGVPANAHPAQVINLSLSGPGPCPQIYTDAFSAGIRARRDARDRDCRRK